MDGRFEYEVAIRIAQLEKQLADAKEQYRDILSEYITLRQNHPRAMDRMHEVEAERDALAAHVNRLTDAALREGSGPMVREVIDGGPGTSLARLKAQWQAEVLERLRELLQETHMDKSPSVSRAAMHVDDAINRVKQECKPLELRRQAKENSNG